MAKYLAQVVLEAREAAGRRTFHIAAAQPGERSLDPSTVYRFEHQQRWPRNPDLLINLYAADLDIEPVELWGRALERWRADVLSPGEEADRVTDEIERAEEPTRDRRGARRRRSG